MRENANLKQQNAMMYSQRDKIIRDCNKFRELHLKAQQQYDDALKDNVAIRIKASKEVKRINDERNATLREYNLIMSER